jgi:hypothetical protein
VNNEGDMVIGLKDPRMMMTPQSNEEVTNVTSSIDDMLPPDLRTFTVYPNPTNENSNVSFTLSAKKQVIIRLYTETGELIKTLENKQMEAGEHIYSIPTGSTSSGTYLLSVSIDGYKKMEFVKIVK